jgi:hypothetical protein
MSESLEEFYTHLLAITDPWEVIAIKRDSISREVVVKVALKVGSQLLCPILRLENS